MVQWYGPSSKLIFSDIIQAFHQFREEFYFYHFSYFLGARVRRSAWHYWLYIHIPCEIRIPVSFFWITCMILSSTTLVHRLACRIWVHIQTPCRKQILMSLILSTCQHFLFLAMSHARWHMVSFGSEKWQDLMHAWRDMHMHGTGVRWHVLKLV